MRCTRTASSVLRPGGQRDLPVDPRRLAASVALRHLPHADQRVRPGPQHQLLQVPDLGQVPLLRRLEDPLPQPPYVVLVGAPVDGVPVEDLVLGPFTSGAVATAGWRRSIPSCVQLVLRFRRSSASVLQRLTCPRQHPFGSGPQAGIRPVIRGDHLEEQPCRPRFPVAFRPPAFASWASCSRRGVRPSSRSAYRAASGPDPDGVSTFRTHEIRPGWVPSIPRDGGVLPAGRRSPAGACRLLSGQPCTPLNHPI